ncbi:MAG: hypothetical protein QNK37_04880 [Acidobacteriota bacterium]|nr:hypothetical protein [Acidobacteriota bacterium]
MRRTHETIQEAQVYMSLNEGEILNRIESASVRLQGPAALGSGVLCKLEQDAYLHKRAMIVTSKSNLLRLTGRPAEEEPPAFNQYAIKPILKTFIETVKIHYGLDNTAAVDHVAVFEPNWSHDLVLLLSLDENLVAYTDRYGIMASTGLIQDHRLYYAEADRSRYRLVQVGYGDPGPAGGDDPKGALATSTGLYYRLVEPATDSEESEDAADTDTLRIDADGNNSMTTGDEGGGLFATIGGRDMIPRVYLVGINRYVERDADKPDRILGNLITGTREIITRGYTQLEHD